MQEKISVVIVTFNSSSRIKVLLRSLLKNSNSIKEIVIVENNSADTHKTKEICQAYGKRIKIRFVIHENEGFAKSCDFGASLTNSNRILFLNPDTELQDNSLEILIRHARNNNADIIGGKAINYKNGLHGSVVRLPNIFIGIFELSNIGKILGITKGHEIFYYEDKNILHSTTDQKVDAVSGAYFLIKRKSFDKLNGFDEKFYMYLEDVDICKRAADLNMKVIFCPHSTIKHVGGASSKNKYKIKHEAWFFSREYYFRKHFGLSINLIIQPLYKIEKFLLKIRGNL